MQNNVNFRNDLAIGYLDSLAEYDHREEFNEEFSKMEDYIKEIVATSKNRDLLERIRRIIAYKEKNKEMTV